MRKYIAIALLFAALVPGAGKAIAQTDKADPDLLVTMPVPPESLKRLDQRCNYIIYDYWNTFNPKSSFSSLSRLNHTLDTFFGLTPFATADTVHIAIDKLIDMVQKARPQNLLELARQAEQLTYCDTARYASEELYYPFVKAIANNKKASGPERDRYLHQFRQLDNSRLGATVADFEFTRPDGTKGRLSDVGTGHILLFFYDPDCTDCSLAKARLDADISISNLIKHNILTVLAIYPGEPDKAWQASAASMPEGWVVGAYPDADRVFTLDNQPEIYYLDRTRKVQAKDCTTDNILQAFAPLNQALEQQKQQRRAAREEARRRALEAQQQQEQSAQ